MAQTIKNLPAMWKMWVRSLGQEDPLWKEMATHSSIPAWKIPWTGEPGWLEPMQSQTGLRLTDIREVVSSVFAVCS